MAKNNDKNQNKNGQNRGQESADRIGQMNENKRQAEIAEEEKKKKAEKEKNNLKPDAFNTMTSNLLKAAWENLVMSWGLTLIWIDIHVFGTLVLGNKLFCKLGMEWVPNALKEARFKEAEKLGKTVGAFEEIGVVGLNLGCLLIVIVAFMIVAMLLSIVSNPLDFFSALVGWVWDKASSIVPFVKK